MTHRFHVLSRSAPAIIFASLLLIGCGPTADKKAPPPKAGAPGADSKNEQAAAKPKEEPAREKIAKRPEILSNEELAAGWIALFDGHSLFGWKAETKADWRVENGAIVVESGEAGLLRTTSQFDNYVLQLEFRSAKGTNSGVFLRTPRKPTAPEKDCYELNIADSDNPFPTASLVKRQKAEGRFDSLDWQSYEVTVEGPQVIVKLDGKEVLRYEDKTTEPLKRGYIGLQLNQGKVEFRKIRLKPLGLQPIFNGRDLSGWILESDSVSEFAVTKEGWLNVKNGRGQLETKQAYGDFVLQLECITHAPDLNSGIFFRCVPNSKMDGYESQIHNGFKDDDRGQPEDYGTGGIFKRQAARVVAADDQRWFHKTLIVDGPHVAVWVNGYQVSDWTDTREPHENPRNGLRLEPGSLMIQGHDPTTNISFRNLRAVEMER